MKSIFVHNARICIYVAPFAGAWIEIIEGKTVEGKYFVAPFAGAWIEIRYLFKNSFSVHGSLPSRERGLKSFEGNEFFALTGRSLRGSVD